MNTNQSQHSKAQAKESFDENIHKLEQFIKDNMPDTVYTCFFSDKEADRFCLLKNSKDNHFGFEPIMVATAINSGTSLENKALSCRIFGTLMTILITSASYSPILLQLFKEILVDAAPLLDGLETIRIKPKKDNPEKDNPESNPLNH